MAKVDLGAEGIMSFREGVLGRGEGRGGRSDKRGKRKGGKKKIQVCEVGGQRQ
jgi:hypothetical protein